MRWCRAMNAGPFEEIVGQYDERFAGYWLWLLGLFDKLVKAGKRFFLFRPEIVAGATNGYEPRIAVFTKPGLRFSWHDWYSGR
jgi:hypothetical protein